MAFENVFGNVDFMAPVRSEYANQAAFQQMIGQAMQNYQAGQDRQLKRKQLEAEANAPIDVKKVGENALLKLDQGLPVTPQEQAAARFVIKTDVGSMRYNPETMQMEPVPPRFGAYRSLVGGQAAPQDVTQAPPMTPPPMTTTPPMAATPTTTGGYRPDLPTIEARQAAAAAENMARLGGGVPAPMTEDDIVSVLDGKPKTDFGSFIDRIINQELPRGREVALTQSLQEYAGKVGIDLEKATEEEKRKLAFEMQKSKPTEELKIKSSAAEAADVNKVIKRLYDNAGAFTTGWLGEKTMNVAGSPAHNFMQDLKTLESDAGLSKLVEVKERGGTFGALQVKELELLIASRAALAQSQSPEQFKRNLAEYQRIRNSAIPMLAESYKQQFGELPQEIKDTLKTLEENKITYYEQGTLAKLPNGKIVVYRGNKWVDYK